MGAGVEETGGALADGASCATRGAAQARAMRRVRLRRGSFGGAASGLGIGEILQVGRGVDGSLSRACRDSRAKV